MRPIGLNAEGSSGILNFASTSPIGFIFASLAISMSDLILFIRPLFSGGLGRIALTTHTFSGYCSTTRATRPKT